MLSRYSVTVHTTDGRIEYSAIGTSSIDIAASAIDMFGVCGVCVRPL